MSYIRFKGGMTTITNIVIEVAIVDKVKEEISDFHAKAPSLLKGMPIVLDFADVEVQSDFVKEVVDTIKSYGAIPFGLKGQIQIESIASLLNLSYLGNSNSNKAKRVKSEENTSDDNSLSADSKLEESNAEIEVPKTKIVNGQVRSGQQIYARGCDLIVLGNVNNGSEVLADGNIHIYGALKGRAMAGLRGDDDAVIFANNFDPEMVVINGDYKVKETISSESINKQVIVTKTENTINIETVI